MGITCPLIAAGVGFETVRNSIGKAVELENAQATFKAIIGNARQAQKLISDVRQISSNTPLTFGGTLDAAKTMLLFNVQVRDVMPNLEALGNITGGNVERMKSLALAFSQATAAGRLQGQDLRQMIDAGFNPLQHIAKKTGEDLATIRDRLSQLGGAAEMTRAFREAGNDLNLLSEMSDTLGGRLAVLGSKVEVMAGKIGQDLAPIVFEVGNFFDRWEGPITNALSLVGKLGDGLSFLIALQSDLMAAFNMDLSSPSALKASVAEQAKQGSAEVKFLDAQNERETERRRQIALQNKGLEQQKQLVGQINRVESELVKSAKERAANYEKKLDSIAQSLSSQSSQIARLRFGNDRAAMLDLAMRASSDSMREWAEHQISQTNVAFSTIARQLGIGADTALGNLMETARVRMEKINSLNAQQERRRTTLEARRDSIKDQIDAIQNAGTRSATPNAAALQRGTVEAYSAARRNEQNNILAKSAAKRNQLLERLNESLEMVEARIARLGTIGNAG